MNNLNNKIYSSNNNLLLEVISDLQQIINNTHENVIIKRIRDIIIKMNFIVNDNKKNTELIINHILSLQNQINEMNKKFDQWNINNNININKQEIISDNGRFIGQVVNGLPEGKGIWYDNNGDRYEGDWKNGNFEGKGIYYWNNDEIYEGDFRNDKKEGKGIMYYHNGDRYEGEWKNGKSEGKGIYYYNKEPYKGDRYEGDYRNGKKEGKGIYYHHNGDRSMTDFYNDKPVGKHVKLTKNGEVKVKNY